MTVLTAKKRGQEGACEHMPEGGAGELVTAGPEGTARVVGHLKGHPAFSGYGQGIGYACIQGAE